MEISCNVIRDLLPLYAEDMVSEDSRELIVGHLAECPQCAETLEILREPVQIPQEPAPKHLKNLGKRLFQRTILLVMAMVFFVSTIVTWTFAVVALSSVPVSMEDVQYEIVEEEGKLFVEIKYIGTLSWWRERDTDTPSQLGVPFPEVGSEITCLSVRRTLWDAFFGEELRIQGVRIPVRDSASVWYVTGNDAQCLWGDEQLPPQHRWDPILLTALFAGCVFLLIYWLTGWKWLGTVSLFTANLLIADLTIYMGVWPYSSYNGTSFLWLIFLFMSLLLTCSELFAYHLWKDRNQI